MEVNGGKWEFNNIVKYIICNDLIININIKNIYLRYVVMSGKLTFI